MAAYRHSLLMGEVDTTVQSTRLAAPAAGVKRRGAKRKLIADGELCASSLSATVKVVCPSNELMGCVAGTTGGASDFQFTGHRFESWLGTTA